MYFVPALPHHLYECFPSVSRRGTFKPHPHYIDLRLFQRGPWRNMGQHSYTLRPLIFSIQQDLVQVIEVFEEDSMTLVRGFCTISRENTHGSLTEHTCFMIIIF